MYGVLDRILFGCVLASSMTAQTPAARKAAQRKRDKDAGMARLDLRAFVDDHPAIKSHAAKLTAKRKQKLQEKK